jgi:serine/threonine protein kinase
MATEASYYQSYRLKSKPELKDAAELGRGGFGVVFLGQVRRPGMLKPELCAVKRVPKANHNFPRDRYEREIATFARLLKVFLFPLRCLKLSNLTYPA